MTSGFVVLQTFLTPLEGMGWIFYLILVPFVIAIFLLISVQIDMKGGVKK